MQIVPIFLRITLLTLESNNVTCDIYIMYHRQFAGDGRPRPSLQELKFKVVASRILTVLAALLPHSNSRARSRSALR